MMKLRRNFLVTVSSLAVLSTALLTGCGSQSQSAADTAPAATEETAVAETQTLETPTLGETGILILSVNPEIRIDYDKDGKVTAISGRNEDGNKIAQAAQDEIGKNCDEVLRNLITEINAAGYFVDDIDGHQKNIVIQIEPGSVLPSDDFLQNMSTSTQDAVKGLSLASDIVTIDEDDYDPTYTTAERPSPYITLEKAQEIALAQADVNAADAVFDDKEFDHDDGTPVFELEFYANGVEYEYDIHAVTGKVIKAEHKGGAPAQTPASTPAQTPASAPAGRTSRKMPRGKRDLQIKAARIGVAVQKLACEIKPPAELAFHGFGIYLPNIDAARSHDRRVDIKKAEHRKRQGFDRLQKRHPLCFGDLVGFCGTIDSRQVQNGSDQRARQQQSEGVGNPLVAVFRKVAQQP